MNKLKNKVAIITGGAGGIGSAAAKLLLSHGAKVMLVGNIEKDLKQLTLNINSANIAYCVADVSNQEDTKRYVDETISKFGRIDILFSNAGIEGTVSPIENYPDDTFNKVIDVNLKGVWYSLKHVLPKISDGGSIIITSSVAGLKGFEGLGAYVASKHGVIGIMRTAAIEYGPRNIRVNTIHPGPVENQMMRRIEKSISPDDSQVAKSGFEANIPLGKYSTSEQIAELVLFLVTDSGKNITGCTYVMDGGMLSK